MNAKKYGSWLILWTVFDYEENGEEYTAASFKDPNSAAMYALEHNHSGVKMELCKPEWNIKTED